MAKKKSTGSARKPAGAVSPLTAGQSTTSEEVQLAVANDDAARSSRQPSYEEIAEAAYQRYLNRGGTHGQDFEDWVQAERELQQRRSR